MKTTSNHLAYRPISSVDQRGSRNIVDKDNKVVCKSSKLLIAVLTGAGIATTAFLLATRARKVVPTAERLLKKCDRAVDALANQVQETFAA
jgi:hypothetical protein